MPTRSRIKFMASFDRNNYKDVFPNKYDPWVSAGRLKNDRYGKFRFIFLNFSYKLDADNRYNPRPYPQPLSQKNPFFTIQ